MYFLSEQYVCVPVCCSRRWCRSVTIRVARLLLDGLTLLTMAPSASRAWDCRVGLISRSNTTDHTLSTDSLCIQRWCVMRVVVSNFITYSSAGRETVKWKSNLDIRSSVGRGWGGEGRRRDVRRWRVEGEILEVERTLSSLSPREREKSPELSWREISTIIYTCYWEKPCHLHSDTAGLEWQCLHH